MALKSGPAVKIMNKGFTAGFTFDYQELVFDCQMSQKKAGHKNNNVEAALVRIAAMFI